MSKATFGSIKTEVGIYKRKKSEILKLFFFFVDVMVSGR